MGRRVSHTFIAIILVLFFVPYQHGLVWAATFPDDFNDGNADGWVVDQGNWSVVNGTYYQDDSSLFQNGFGGRMPSHINGSNYGNFEATVEAQVVSSPTRQRELGVYFRSTADLQNFYHLRILGGQTLGDDHFEIWKYVNGIGTTRLQQTVANYLSNGTWLIFKLSANGNQIKAKLWEKGTSEPDQWNLTVNDSTYTGGLFALDTYVAKGRFDNVNIYYATPPITLLSPTNTTYTRANISLNVSANETVDTWQYSLNGGPNITFLPNTTFTAAEGANSIIVTANYTDGNRTTITVYFTVDTTPPIVTILSPTNDTYTQANVWVNVTLDNNSGNVTAQLNGATNYTLANSSGNWNRLLTGLSNRGHDIRIFANDSFGNMIDTEVVYFTVNDTIPPVLYITSPRNTTYSRTNISINVSANETVDTWQYSLNDGPNVTFTPANATFIAAEGANRLVVTANDTAGNRNTTTVYFTVHTAPAVTIKLPTNTTYTHTTVWVNVTLDNNSGNVTAQLDGIKNYSLINYNGLWYYEITGLSNGAHNIRIFANDSLGNMNNMEVVYFTVNDITPPVITVASPQWMALYTTRNISLNVSANETIDAWQYSLNSALNVTFVPNTTFTAAEGANSLNITANDTAGNRARRWTWFTVDTTGPAVRIDSPTNTTYAQAIVWVNVTLNDNSGSVIAQLDATTNYSLTNSSGNWNRQLTGLTDGAHNIRIFANDSLRNTNSTEVVYFTVNDTTPPAIYIASPQNITYARTNIELKVSANEPINTWQYSLNDGPNVTFILNTTFTATEGANRITVTANDTTGNRNTTTIHFTVDTTSPAVALIAPANDSNFSTTSVTFNFTATDGRATQMTFTIFLDGQANFSGTIANNTFNIATVTGIPDGLHRWFVNVSDFVNNTGTSETRFFRIDNVAPVVTLFAPVNNTNHSRLVTFNFTATDNRATSITFTLFLDGVANFSGTIANNTVNTSSITDIADGLHNWSVRANDGLQNGTSETRFFRIDNTPSVLYIASPTNTTYAMTNVELNVSANEPIHTWHYSLNGGPNVTFVPNTTFTAAEGANRIVVTANDTTGNRNTATANFTVDMTPPIVTILTPTNDTYNQANVWVNVTLNENMTTVIAQLDKTANHSLTNSSGNWNYLLTGLSNGAHNMRIFANDSFGNTNSTQVVYFTVSDTTSPVLYIASPTNTTYTRANISLNVSANETVGTWQYSLNGGPNVTFTPANAAFTAVEGANRLVVTANDTAGNRNTTKVYFTVDTTPPAVAINSPTNTTYVQASVWANVTLNDDSGNVIARLVYALGYTITNYTLTNSSGNWNYLITDLVNGSYHVRIFANDSFGNTNSTQVVYFTVSGDTAPPVLYIASPQNITYTRMNISLNVAANDTIHTWQYSFNSGPNITFVPNTTFIASEGANRITVTANDTAGNRNITTVYFTVDIFPPLVTVLSPTNTTYTQATVPVNVTLNDNSGNVTAQFDGTNNYTLINSFGKWHYLLTGLANGSHNVRIFANDSVGNMNSTEVVYFTLSAVDTPPVANAGPDKVVNDTDHNGFENVKLNGSLSFDPDGTIVNFTWFEGGNISLPPTTNGDLNAPTLIGVGEVINASFSVGVHNVTLNVTDNNGSSSLDNVTIKVNAPALNTPSGTNVTVANETIGLNVTFGNSTSGGITVITATSDGPQPPSGFNLTSSPPIYYDITTTANYTGTIEISIKYNESQVVGPEQNLKLMHWNGTAWEDVTTYVDVDNNIIHGSVTALSPFAVMELRTVDKTPPEAVIRFDAASKDINVYNNETGSEAGYKALPSKNDEPDEDGERGWELRQYALKDSANNSLVLLLRHKKEGNEVKIKVLSTQYNGSVIIEAVGNQMQVAYSEGKNGTFKELKQRIGVKKQFSTEAKYNAKKNETEIKTNRERQKEQKETREGVVILELLTDKGSLKLRQ